MTLNRGKRAKEGRQTGRGPSEQSNAFSVHGKTALSLELAQHAVDRHTVDAQMFGKLLLGHGDRGNSILLGSRGFQQAHQARQIVIIGSFQQGRAEAAHLLGNAAKKAVTKIRISAQQPDDGGAGECNQGDIGEGFHLK